MCANCTASEFIISAIQYNTFLLQVGRMFPQAVYFPIRTLYLTLKIEQRERYKSAEQAAANAGKLAASSQARPQKHGVSKQVL